MKGFLKYLMVTVKGICMGAADVIPGVSGGTIAFMTGIYETLVGSINAINLEAVKLLFTGKFRQFWRHINGNFLLSLIAGILISILSLAKLMTYLLTHQPIQTWAFFFGLIVASSIFILRGVKKWKIKDYVMLVLGIIIGVVVCTLSPTTTPDGLWFIFICGAIAICAMILPGISGSFILLILGKYEYMMGTISDIVSGTGNLMDFVTIIVFVVGAAAGIIAFAKFLHWLLEHYHRETLLVMAGFIIGSLVVVWPWSSRNMETIVLSQFPALTPPQATAALAPEIVSKYSGMIDMHIGGAVAFALIGFFLVIGIEMASVMISRRRGSEESVQPEK